MLTVIPFSGFFQSIHSDELQSQLQRYFENNDALLYKAIDCVDWREVQKEYAKEYAQNFANCFGLLTLRFESLQSPREYNFATDRIFCHIDCAEVKRILAKTDTALFEKKAREMFTSRSGFISFYDPDISQWGDVETWDHNKVYCLLCAYVEQEHSTDWDMWAEGALMEDWVCNGHLDSAIWATNPQKLYRFFTIQRYLEKRAER